MRVSGTAFGQHVLLPISLTLRLSECVHRDMIHRRKRQIALFHISLVMRWEVASCGILVFDVSSSGPETLDASLLLYLFDFFSL